MSKTLFWYILRDLLKIFFMTAGVLGGILSFAGLLKPMMKQGLSAPQMLQMLGYLTPMTQTFAIPFAALFATTMVYGRLSADNELTACRATGISFGVLTLPAFFMGLALALICLLSLCWVVPTYALKVERTAWSNIAKYMQNNIETEHKIKLPQQTIYADEAVILPAPPDHPTWQMVLLKGPIFCSTDLAPAPGQDPKSAAAIPMPMEFYVARSATVVIQEDLDDVTFSAFLDGGVMFPRKLMGGQLGGVAEGNVGPIHIGSIIRENTKFMTVEQLKALYHEPIRSREVKALFNEISRQEQETRMIEEIRSALGKGRGSEFTFRGDNEQSYRVILDRTARPNGPRGKSKITYGSLGERRDIRLEQIHSGQVMTTADARYLTMKVQADQLNQRMRLEFQVMDAQVGVGEDKSGRQSLSYTFSVPMPDDIKAIALKKPADYLTSKSVDAKFKRKFTSLISGIIAELHGRVSYAISCFTLVMVGCTLGMMFRAGNFLTAFALSLVPALFCLVLINTGQHVSEADFKNWKMGVSLIWSGNAIVLGLGVFLLTRLHRT